MEDELKNRAQEYFRGVYGGEPEVVDTLAAKDVVSTYPIFKNLFKTPALQGQTAVKDFALGFSQRWDNAQIKFHEAIAEGSQVVLLWSFRARRVETKEEHSWGGITYFRFDVSGRIVAEIGEESTPGPFERWALEQAPQSFC